MAFITNSLVTDFFLSVPIFVFVVFKFLTRKYGYWEKRGIAHIKPTFPFGSMSKQLLNGKDHFGLADKKIYDQFNGEKYVGVYMLSEPQLMVRDVELIKHIMTKDFSHFTMRGFFPKLKHDFITHHLFNMEGDEWKRMRTKLTPTFTSGKMKMMFNLIEVIAQQLTEFVKPLAEKNSIIEIKDIAARFNTDIIATCAFGLDVNSLKDPDSEFREMGRLIFKPSLIMAIKRNILLFTPILTKFIPIVVVKPKVSNFILNVLKDTIEYRKKNNVVRNDFIDLLTKVKEKTLILDKEEETVVETHHKFSYHAADDDEFTLKEMAAQVFVFFAAGFETASSTISFCLFELSKNKDIQDKVRSEIDTVLQASGGKVTYQALQEMHYLEKCINGQQVYAYSELMSFPTEELYSSDVDIQGVSRRNGETLRTCSSETLRRYASLPFLRRECVKSYKVPDSDFVIEEGTKVIIPTYAIHHDPKYYPEPYTFNPERFSKEAINSRHNYTHLPFGEGPRVCIGKRLGMMQVKMAIITILKDFEVSPGPTLPDQIPIKTGTLLTEAAVPIELLISKRKT